MKILYIQKSKYVKIILGTSSQLHLQSWPADCGLVSQGLAVRTFSTSCKTSGNLSFCFYTMGILPTSAAEVVGKNNGVYIC